jgi:hypothetical protein
VPPEQCHIFGIGLPYNIEDISHNGYGTDHSFQGNVPDHSEEGADGETEASGLDDDIDREHGAGGVADPRDQPHNSIQTDPKACTRDSECVIQKLTELIQTAEVIALGSGPQVFINRMIHWSSSFTD